MKKAVIFDLDGTLWDSSAQVTEAWNAVLRRHPKLNRQITADDMHGYMGKTMYDIARLMLPGVPEEEIRAVMDECCDYENEYLETHGGVLFPRLEETLSALRENYGLYIVSNCQDGYIQVFMKYHRLEKYFADIECQGRTGKSKAENIALVIKRNNIEKAVYVGDTALDMESADEAGIPFIHAAYGFGSVTRRVPAVKAFSELPSAVSEIFLGKL